MLNKFAVIEPVTIDHLLIARVKVKGNVMLAVLRAADHVLQCINDCLSCLFHRFLHFESRKSTGRADEGIIRIWTRYTVNRPEDEN